MGFGLEIEFIDYLQIMTTNNYNNITNPHTLQITIAQAKPFQSAFTSRFLVTGLNSGDPSASVLMLLVSGEYPTTALLLQLTISQAGSHLTNDQVFSSHIDN
jgi:hypothetical protein